MHILIIDDDAGVRETLADILALNGYKVVVASHGAEGFALAKNSPPALIITDILMPVMDGFALLAACQADAVLQTVPVIITSAKDDREDIRHAMELGAADYISKPFTEREVVRSVAVRIEKKELIDELDAFAHTAAHDLKGPLTTLGVRLDLATYSIQQNKPEDALQHLALLGKSTTQLANIIDELLLLSGVRREEVDLAPIAMAGLVIEAADRAAHLLEGTGAKISLPNSWPDAVGYAPWIVHVWANFLSNAAKYAGPAAQISLGAEACADGHFVRFWVQDQGPGLSEADQVKVFTPFTRLAGVRARGHGLGLSIVRRIVEKLDGKVGVTSSPGAGARFWFELPVSIKPKSVPSFIPPCVF